MAGRAVLRYDRDMDCWYVTLGSRRYAVHCGETYRFKIGGHMIPCRVELSHDWYVWTPDHRFVLHPLETYVVEAVV